MPRRLIYSRVSLSDLDGITRWLTQPGAGTAAQRRLDAIWGSIERLRRNPRLCPVGGRSGMREMPCGDGRLALYRVRPDTGRDDAAGDVRVLRGFGPGRSRG